MSVSTVQNFYFATCYLYLLTFHDKKNLKLLCKLISSVRNLILICFFKGSKLKIPKLRTFRTKIFRLFLNEHLFEMLNCTWSFPIINSLFTDGGRARSVRSTLFLFLSCQLGKNTKTQKNMATENGEHTRSILLLFIDLVNIKDFFVNINIYLLTNLSKI